MKGRDFSKSIRKMIKEEIAEIRKEEEKIFKENNSKHINKFGDRISKLEKRFVKESETVRKLLEQNKLDQEPVWKKFTEEVITEAKKELQDAEENKKTINFKKILKKLDSILEFIASDK